MYIVWVLVLIAACQEDAKHAQLRRRFGALKKVALEYMEKAERCSIDRSI